MAGANTIQAQAKLVRAGRETSEQTKNGPARRREAVQEMAVRQLLQEHRLEIYVNEQLVARLVCTDNDLENLVVGRLVTEGIISDITHIEQMYLCESGNRARVFLKENVRLVPKDEEEPTCCTDNHVYLAREDDDQCKATGECMSSETTGQSGMKERKADEIPERRPGWKPEWIFGIVNAFAQDSALHKSTGGTHSCMLAVADRIMYKAEDIGRHNAMDKAIGYAVREKLDVGKCILFTTGRVPTDMVRKAVTAGIPVLVSKAVPTAEAVEMASENGLTLICRAWPDSFEVYA